LFLVPKKNRTNTINNEGLKVRKRNTGLTRFTIKNPHYYHPSLSLHLKPTFLSLHIHHHHLFSIHFSITKIIKHLTFFHIFYPSIPKTSIYSLNHKFHHHFTQEKNPKTAARISHTKFIYVLSPK
jgi:hypothetical protein